MSLFKPTRFEMQILGILVRIMRSATFNTVLLLSGFLIGIVATTLNVHYHAVTNSNYESIARLEQCVQDLRELDKHYAMKQQEILTILKYLKIKLSHDKCNFDFWLDPTFQLMSSPIQLDSKNEKSN